MARFVWAIVVGLLACDDRNPRQKARPRALESSPTSAVMLYGARVVVAEERVASEQPARVSEVRRPTSTTLAIGGGRHDAAPTMMMAVEACAPHWKSIDIDRCIAGDGDGCTGIGDEYETGACDGFSSIKWYRRGCRLGSASSCAALVRLGEPVPPPID